jgi:hypothetical protein
MHHKFRNVLICVKPRNICSMPLEYAYSNTYAWQCKVLSRSAHLGFDACLGWFISRAGPHSQCSSPCDADVLRHTVIKLPRYPSTAVHTLCMPTSSRRSETWKGCASEEINKKLFKKKKKNTSFQMNVNTTQCVYRRAGLTFASRH